MGDTLTLVAQSHDVEGVNASQSHRRVIFALEPGAISGKGCLGLRGFGSDQMNDITASCWGPGLLVVNEFGFHRI